MWGRAHLRSGGSKVQDHPRLCSENLSQNQTNEKQSKLNKYLHSSLSLVSRFTSVLIYEADYIQFLNNYSNAQFSQLMQSEFPIILGMITNEACERLAYPGHTVLRHIFGTQSKSVKMK